MESPNLHSPNDLLITLRGTTVSESTAAGARIVHWCAGVGMDVCHVVTFCRLSGCSWVFALEAHCLEGREVHRVAVSRNRSSEEEGSRVGSQDLALGEDRCVGLCAGWGVMVH